MPTATATATASAPQNAKISSPGYNNKMLTLFVFIDYDM